MRDADRDQHQAAPSRSAPRIPAQRTPSPPSAEETFSPLAKLGVGAVIALALAWFFVSWLALKSPLTDAIGETVGSLAVLLLIVSVIGAARS